MPNQITFGKSIKNFFRNYLNFSGRTGRKEFWWTQLFLFTIYSVLYGGLMAAGLTTIIRFRDTTIHAKSLLAEFSTFWLVFAIVAIVLLILTPGSLSLNVRRLHDTGKSGLWLLVAAIPFGYAVLLVFYLLPGDGPNVYGSGREDDLWML